MASIMLGMVFFAVIGGSIFAIVWKVIQQMKRSSYYGLRQYGVEAQLLSDKYELKQLGYEQLLARQRSGITLHSHSIKGFAAAGGLLMVYAPAVELGGLSVIGFGLPLAAWFALLTAASLAELSGSMPASGGTSYWSGSLGGPIWRLRAGWLSGAGHIAMLTFWNLGAAAIIDALLAAKFGYNSSILVLLLLAVVVAASQAVYLIWIDSWLRNAGKGIAIAFQLLLAAGAAAALLWLAKPALYPPEILYMLYNSELNGRATWMEWIAGSVLLTVLFTGAGGASHLAEEANEPRVRVPWAVFQGTFLLALISLLLFTASALYIGVAREGGIAAVVHAIAGLIGRDNAAATVVYTISVLCLWGCGLQTMHVCSRMLFSLARDQAIPFSSYWEAVRHRSRLPARAIALCSALSVLLLAAVIIVDSGRSVMLLAALMLIFIHGSYAIPIALRLHKGRVVMGRNNSPWSLGQWSRPVHAAALVWLCCTALGAAFVIHHGALVAFAVVMLAVTVMQTMSSLEMGNKQKHFPGKRNN